jgi:FkbM family methyltransferase
MKRLLYGSCPGLAGSFPYYGVRTYFPRRSLVFALACDQGIYEAANVRLLLSALRPGTTVFDVGANIGLMSIPLLVQGPSVRVVAFEPSPNNVEHLRRTALESVFRERWEVVASALGDRIGEVSFYCAAPGLGAFDGLADTGRAGATTAVRVPLTTLDAAWEQRGRPEVSAIKIDVEGAELSVLRGGGACLRATRPVVLAEWNEANLRGFGCDAGALLAFAAESGYDVFAMPTLVRVSSVAHLRSLMQFDESFALLPLS